jgi:hypothetical protein
MNKNVFLELITSIAEMCQITKTFKNQKKYMDVIEQNKIAARFLNLQKLCSDEDSNYPKALLFILGQDGRNNKGSITMFKYLFMGSVSSDLFDETLDSTFEQLEEVILLIDASTVSVVWRFFNFHKC